MKRKSSRSPLPAVAVAATAAVITAALVGVYFFTHRTPQAPAAPEPRAVVRTAAEVPPAPPPQPEPPAAETPERLLAEATTLAEQKKPAEARGLLVRALAMNPPAAVRARILAAMLPVGRALLQLASDTPDIEIYKVRTGDTFERLGRRFGAGSYDYGALLLANRRTSPALRVADTLRVPKGTFSILVVKSAFRVYLMYEGAAVRDYPCAVGRSGENETPSTVFTVHSKTEHPVWNPPEQLMREKGLPSVVPPGDPQNPLGTHWIALKHAVHKGFGIHGTNDPKVIGTEATLGCVRLHNEDAAELFSIVATGMSVTVVD